MPLVKISLYPGRTREQKEEFAKSITDAAIKILNTKPEHIIVIFEELSKENWYMSGKPL